MNYTARGNSRISSPLDSKRKKHENRNNACRKMHRIRTPFPSNDMSFTHLIAYRDKRDHPRLWSPVTSSLDAALPLLPGLRARRQQIEGWLIHEPPFRKHLTHRLLSFQVGRLATFLREEKKVTKLHDMYIILHTEIGYRSGAIQIDKPWIQYRRKLFSQYGFMITIGLMVLLA